MKATKCRLAAAGAGEPGGVAWPPGGGVAPPKPGGVAWPPGVGGVAPPPKPGGVTSASRRIQQ